MIDFKGFLSLLEIHGAGVSIENATQKLLRSLRSAWSDISIIMRNKPGVDNLDIDDMYNNLKVYKADIKGSSGSLSNSQNVAFVSAESISSINELNVAYSVSTAAGNSSQAQEQIDQDDLEEMDLKWKVDMLSMRVKDCRSTKNSGNRSRDARNVGYIGRDNGKRPAKEENENELVVQDGLVKRIFRYLKGHPKLGLWYPKESPFDLVAYSDSDYGGASQDRKSTTGGCQFLGRRLILWQCKKKTIVATSTTEAEYVVAASCCGQVLWIQNQLLDYSDNDSVFRPEHIPVKIDFVKAVFTRSGRIPVSAAKPKVAASTSVAKPVNTIEPKQSVHFSKSRSTFHTSHSPIRRSFYNKIGHSRRNSTGRVNTVGLKAVSAVKGNRVTTVKTSVGYVWRPRVNAIDQISKYNRWICIWHHLQQALKNKGIVNSWCSRHMTGNKTYLANYQEISDEGYVALVQVDVKLPAKNVVPSGDLTCLFSKASIDESNLWHKRLGHVNFKTMNKLVKGNLINKEIKVIRCDNGIKFKNRDLDEFYRMKGIKRALMTKSQDKTPYELLNGRTPRLDFMRPFSCPVTILNTLDPLGEFKGKADEGFLVGYSITIKAFRVMLKPKKLKRISMLVYARNQTDKNAGPQDTNGNEGTQDNVGTGKEVSDQHYIMFPLWSSISSTFKSSNDKTVDDKPKDDTCSKTIEEPAHKEDQAYRGELDRLMSQQKEASDAANAIRKELEQGCMDQRGATKAGSTNSFSTISNPVNVISTSRNFSAGGPSSPHPDAFILANILLHVYRNKKDERGIVVRNKSRLVAQGHRQEERIHYNEVFALVAQIKAIIFLAFASFMGFIIYQMDVKSAFLYGTMEEEVYVSQPPGFIDLHFPNKVYVDDISFESTKKSLCDVFEALMHKRFQMSSMRELTFFFGLQVKQSEEGIFISQDKYVAEILKKFDFSSIKIASTPIEPQKPLVKDEKVENVDVHLYTSMVRSLMYLTASRLDIMFAVCACSRFPVTPKLSHLRVVKWIFRKSTTRGCHFLSRRLISWQCKKKTIVVSSTTEAEYFAAMDRDSYEKKLIQVLKIHTDDNVANLLTKAFHIKKTKSNVEFHQIVDFLTLSSIHHSLTISPTIYASNIEQFWNTGTSQTINDAKQIHAILDGRR
nr:ribonuclease H-like domain, reverse transcriptase, RNA-dependent DNA polymerase [Tanacetum cinerariifolium]